MNRTTAYAPLTDEQLCEKLFQGDEGAGEFLLERYMPLVRGRASVFSGGGYESEDLVQEGLVALLAAMRGYRPDCNASFKTFAYACVTNRMLTAVKRFSKARTAPIGEYDAAAEHSCDPLEIISRQELLCDKTLSELEKNAFRLYLDGYSYREMAASLQSTTKAVDNALQRARKKLRQSMAQPNPLECKPLSAAEK